MELRGTEATTLEIGGTLSANAARALAGPLEVELVAGRARASLLVFDMRGMRVTGVPGPALEYREALWRVGVVVDGVPSWFAVACDLDSGLVRALGKRLVRYPVRRARFGLRVLEEEGTWEARVSAREGSLSVRAELSAKAPEAVAPRPVYVRAGSRTYQIPWQEQAAPFRREARVEVSGDLAERTFGGTITWDAVGLAHRGRVHQCGVAGEVAGM
jgi:hypothetical protein